MSVDIKQKSQWDSLVSSKNLVAPNFWAPWCPYCRTFKPVFETVALEYPEIRFVKVNVDELPDVASRSGILAIPVVKFFCEDKEVGEAVESASKKSFKAEVEKISTFQCAVRKRERIK
jgi:thioredoxin 1